jgi:hypothetical protein
VKEKAGDAVREPGVVVGPARHDDLGAVRERALGEPERLEVVAPHRARQRAMGVAQLEPHARPGDAEVPDLAEELHACALAQPRPQLRRVDADRPRPGELRTGDARRP